MTHTFKERLSLRQLRKAANSKLFGQQNSKISKILNIDPAWLHQSRLNYRYIYSSLDAYWPDWALKQFNPFSATGAPPNTELTCLNTSTRSTFSFNQSIKNHRLDINQNGFMSYPFLYWGIELKLYDEDQFIQFFDSAISLHQTDSSIFYTCKKNELLTKFHLNVDEHQSVTHLTL